MFLLKPFGTVYRILTGRRRVCQVVNHVKYVLSKKNAAVVNYKPICLGIFTSYECNLECDMCLTHGKIIPDNPYKYKGAEQMRFAVFKDIMAKFPETLLLNFIGNGEPLLNKDIFKMIAFGKKEGKAFITLFSNGMVLDRFIDKILQENVDTMHVSVNAHNYKNYKRYTGMPKKSFEKIVANTKKLVEKRNHRKNNTQISISLIVGKANYREIPAMVEFAEQLGVDKLYLSAVMPTLAGGWSAKEICLYNEPKVVEFIEREKKKPHKMFIGWPVLLDGNTNNRLCRDAWSSMSIDGNGDVSACERQCLNSEDHGKYWEKNVFNNRHFQEWRSIFLSGEKPLPEPCKTCYNNSKHSPGG